MTERDHITGYDIRICGRISAVRFVEQAFGATKVRHGRYWAYAFQTGPDGLSRADYERIAGDTEFDAGTGCWIEEHPIFDEAALDAAEAADQAARDAEPIHAGIAAHLRAQGKPATNDTCALFIEIQLDTLWRSRGLTPNEQREVQAILWQIDSTAAGAAAYVAAKKRMQELAAKARR